jgi:hypothetical protein
VVRKKTGLGLGLGLFRVTPMHGQCMALRSGASCSDRFLWVLNPIYSLNKLELTEKINHPSMYGRFSLLR